MPAMSSRERLRSRGRGVRAISVSPALPTRNCECNSLLSESPLEYLGLVSANVGGVGRLLPVDAVPSSRTESAPNAPAPRLATWSPCSCLRSRKESNAIEME
eukprot:scaffold249325_cov30-Tisochrysis_lutea.AAC.2